MIMKPITKLSDIPSKLYTGYVWFSDKAAPKVLHNEHFDFGQVGLNPFLIEALLWNETDNTSLIVRHTGKYHIYEYDLKNLPEGYELVDKKYLPHRLENNIEKVNFKQLWLPEPDPHSDGMMVLTMKALIFTGFKYKTSNK